VQSLPPVVFQHYREPQHKGPIPDADGSGSATGRGADSLLTLFLKLDSERQVSAVGFTAENDRASDAPMSMLSSYCLGRSLPELESLSVETLAATYELSSEQAPLLLPAWEALQSALAKLQGHPDPCAFDGRLVCHCLGVREGRILRAIRQRDLKTVAGVSHWTRACTGCRSCRKELEGIIRSERQS